MSVENWAVKAMEEMHAEGLPIKKFEWGANGFDFFFGRGLKKSEQKKAQTIANKYLPTQYSWHGARPTKRVPDARKRGAKSIIK